MNYLEITAALLGLIGVCLYIRQNHWAWPIGIVMYILYFSVFYSVRLYADMSMQLLFACLQCYGWWQWRLGGVEHQGVRLSHLTWRLAYRLIILVTLCSCILIFLLQHYTDGQMIVLDSILTSASIAVQWLLARKIIENWLCWFVIDTVHLGMYLDLHLYPTCFLYISLLFLAWKGYFTWKRDYDEQRLLVPTH